VGFEPVCIEETRYVTWGDLAHYVESSFAWHWSLVLYSSVVIKFDLDASCLERVEDVLVCSGSGAVEQDGWGAGGTGFCNVFCQSRVPSHFNTGTGLYGRTKLLDQTMNRSAMSIFCTMRRI